MSDRTRGWTCWHAFHHGDAGEVDRLLVEGVGPAVARITERRHPQGWFYLRYWDGGPHVRVRVQGLDEQRALDLAAALRSWLREHPPERTRDPAEHYAAHGVEPAGRPWHAHGEVVGAGYDPEFDRYGGAAAMDLAEDLFVASTRLALGALPRVGGDPARRLGVAFTFFAAGVLALCPDPLDAALLLRRYVLGARWNGEGGSVDVAAARAAAERNWERNAPAYSRRLDAVIDACGDGESGAGAVRGWHRTVRAYVEKVRAVGAESGLGPWATEAGITLSQLHMFNNRLGTGITDEYQVAWLLSLALTERLDRRPDAGMFLPPGAGLAGALHRASGYSAASMPVRGPAAGERASGERASGERAPGERAPGERAPGRPAGTAVVPPSPGVELPQPRPAGAEVRALTAVLARRRSASGRFDGALAAAEVSTLLGATTSTRDGRLFAYPAAGALPAVELIVLPAGVHDLPPDLFAYHPPGRLRLLRRAPALAELQACSPYFTPRPGPDGDGGGGPELTHTPLWVFVVADLRALTGKYGQRAYRFACLQAGHAAQNLLLVAEAMRLRARLIGGFHDDALALFLGVDGVTRFPLYAIPLAPAVEP